MSPEIFDKEAFFRAIIISIGVGFIINTIGFFVMRERSNWNKRWPVLLMGTIGITALLAVGIYYAVPTLIKVPSLNELSQADTENILTRLNLVPEARPQYGVNVDAGKVIPFSQNPKEGLLVKKGTVVSFAVNVRIPQETVGSVPDVISLSLFSPRSGEKIHGIKGADNVFRFTVKGVSSGLSVQRCGLLLWMRPVKPPSEAFGWYLQRLPINGINKIEADGTWSGIIQIGNAAWPPNTGDIVDIAVTVASDSTIQNLMAEEGIVTRAEPVGGKVNIATGLVFEK
jgi:hypothetical protein